MTVDPWRVAQIAADRGPRHEGSRGSGYLIAPGRVLTAAHVVAGALVVRVRLDVGQETQIDVQAESWWADPAGHEGTDLAIITIPKTATAGRAFEPARFGRISDCAAVLSVGVFGFPLFKLKDDPANVGQHGVFRDLEQVSGHAPVAANRRQGTLAVYLDDPVPATAGPGSTSPWAGMSGAAVWAAGRIVGVVAEHRPLEGTGRLTARRIDDVYNHLSKSDFGQLAAWLGLPLVVAGMPDVVPAEPGRLIQAAYLEQVRHIAPDELVGRDDELAAWGEFCAGNEAYAWWRAGPWAGKSALASWFVTHPPAGVDVVSFFITGRLAGQADSNAFLDAMIEQLHALGCADERPLAITGAKVGMWLSLLTSATLQAQEQGRRLVVVVDGLDEDNAGAVPLRERPSIASLLPRRPQPGVRVIITSRSDPGVPDDVPSDHPLRTCIPHRLSESQIAKDLARLAQQELRDLLTGEQTAINVVGAIAASGGGLTSRDLSSVTGAPPRKLEHILRGVSGRSLETRAPADSRDAEADLAVRVYLFAHETLRTTAEEQLGNELACYRERVHDWIGSYANRGWPDSTSSYAIRGYVGLLTTTNDTARLWTLTRDRRRHAFLGRATGSDYAALTEIRIAQQLLASQDMANLQALVELAVCRHAISIHNRWIPADLPTVWAMLGRLEHAEALANTISDPGVRTQALTGLVSEAARASDPDHASRLATAAEALARTLTAQNDLEQAIAGVAGAIAKAGDFDRAQALARTISGPDARAQAFAWIASAAIQVSDLDHAEILTRAITHPNHRSRTLAELARAAAQAGDPDRTTLLATDAEALALTIANPYYQAQALAEVASAIAQVGDFDRAQALACTIPHPYDRVEALAKLTGVAARVGDTDRATRLAAKAEAVTHTITDDDYYVLAHAELVGAFAQAADFDHAEALNRFIADSDAQIRALAGMARAATQTDEFNRVEALARNITDPLYRVRALTELARAAARIGDPDRAFRLATAAEALARTLTNPHDLNQALTTLARAATQVGDFDHAEALAMTMTRPYDQTKALVTLVRAAAQTGDFDHAEALARTITTPRDQERALTALAREVAEAGDFDRAEALARTITDPYTESHGLIELARAAAQAGHSDQASRLASDAEAVARTITFPNSPEPVLAELAREVAEAGDFDRAEALARTTSPSTQAQTLVALARAAAQAGHPDQASRLATDAEAQARTISDTQPGTLAALARALAEAGDFDHAEALARTITSSDKQGPALVAVASAAAQAGEFDYAEALARTLTILHYEENASPYYRARALAAVASAAARAGDLDRAETLARLIIYPKDQARALAAVASAAAQAGDLDRAEALACAITTQYDQAQAFTAVASAAAQAGDLDRAEALALTITDSHYQAQAFIAAASAAARVGGFESAETLALAITTPYDQAQALADLASAAAQVCDLDRASRLATDAEAVARTITSPEAQARVLIVLAIAVAEADDSFRARRLLALALCAESPEIGMQIEGVSRLFPSAVRDAGGILVNAYKADG